MLELDACPFYYLTSVFEQLKGMIEVNREKHEEIIPDAQKASMFQDADLLLAHLVTLNAKIAMRAHEDLIFDLMREDLKWGQLGHTLDFFTKVLVHELGEVKILIIETDKQRYFESRTPLFGKRFQESFISGAFELDEAAKCLALGRPTASVFHLMRMMEIGVRAVARCLGIPDPLPADRSWGPVLKKVREGIDAKWPTVAARSSGDGELFDALYASLDAVKNPWRNPTMHPANKYTDDEAEHIFVAVRGFMMKLASRCDENGEPKV
jgi:hypothetical protein